MPRTRSLAWSELKLGVMTIVALLLAAVTIVMLTGSRGFFWQQYGLKARFPNVAGLKPGSPVRVAGIAVGTVGSDWTFVGSQVDIPLRVNKDVRDRITSSSVATLGSISLLGESSVDITPATTGTPIPEWGYVPPGRIPAQIADITDSAGQGIQELTALVQDVRQGKGTVGKLMTDQQVYDQLERAIRTLGDLADGLRRGNGSVGKLLTDKTTANELEQSLKNVETLTAQLNAGEGSIGRLLKDDAFARSLQASTDNLQALVAKINRGEGSAGKLLTDTGLYDRLNSASDRLDTLIAQLNQGEGTVGQLLKDRQLYENMNKVTAELSTLIADIQKNPRKYFPNKISIF